jgi:L-threonylcarbamoyladenylate synthase
MIRYLTLDPEDCDPADLRAAAEWIQNGGVVAFPTDTLYGLAVSPLSQAAVRTLFELKGRPRETGVPLIAASREQVLALGGRLSPASARLADRFWPGPLSLILDAPDAIAPGVAAQDGSVAVRVPSHPVARALAAACGYWVTSTSANRSGDPAAVVPAALGTLADDPRLFVVDAGRVPGGEASTIVDARGAKITLVREGAVAWSRVLESLQE